MTMQENSLSLSEANMMIHENGTKLLSSHELRQLKTNQLETSYMFRENEHLISDYIVTDKNGDNHFYSIEKWPSLEIVACGIRKLETALFIASSLNQANSLPHIKWQSIDNLTDHSIDIGKNYLFYNKVSDPCYSIVQQSFVHTDNGVSKVMFEYESYIYDIEDLKDSFTHFVEITSPKE